MSKMLENPDNLIDSDRTFGSKRSSENSSIQPRIDYSFELMTESELIHFLRISEVSNSKNHHNVIENLKRMHNLPRIYICGKALYPQEAIREWIRQKTTFR